MAGSGGERWTPMDGRRIPYGLESPFDQVRVRPQAAHQRPPKNAMTERQRVDDADVLGLKLAKRRSARASMLNRPAPNTTTTRASTPSAMFKS